MGYPDTLADIGVVRISDSPPQIGINGDLWLNPTAGELSVSFNGKWVVVSGSAAAQVVVGDQPPTDPNALIWIDTSGATPAIKYLVNGQWIKAAGTQVYAGDVTPTDPDTIVWIDTTASTAAPEIKYFIGGSWVNSTIDIGTF